MRLTPGNTFFVAKDRHGRVSDLLRLSPLEAVAVLVRCMLGATAGAARNTAARWPSPAAICVYKDQGDKVPQRGRHPDAASARRQDGRAGAGTLLEGNFT